MLLWQCASDVIPLVSKDCVSFIYLFVLSQLLMAGPTPNGSAPLGREAGNWVMFYDLEQFESLNYLQLQVLHAFGLWSDCESRPRNR